MGEPKHLMRLPDGRTLLHAVADALRPHVGRIVLVIGRDAPGAPCDFPVIADLRRGEGPLAGLEALLSSGLDEQYLVCPCDIPLIDGPIIRSLTRASSAPATVLHIEGEQRPRPLPARFSHRALDHVRALLDAGERSIRALIDSLDVDAVETSAAEGRGLLNVNDASDFRKVCAVINDQPAKPRT